MTIWRRGDKAGCFFKMPADDGLEVGKVYTVFSTSHGGQALQLVELPNEPSLCTCGEPNGWVADRFRKVIDDKREAHYECPALLDVLKKQAPAKRDRVNA